MLPLSKSIALKSGASVAVLSLLMGGAASAHGLPSNGHFVSGQGQIGKGAQSLTVKQSSTTGIINWNSFSVGKNNSVSFNNGNGATLNRVTGGSLSTIAGSLHATGSLYLMNNAGVIVSGTGHVMTGGSFVASSGAIASDSLGKLRLKSGNGVIINRGSIAAGGNAVLNGRGAANEGHITASSVRLNATTGNALDTGTIAATGNTHHAAHVFVISQSGKTRISGDLVAHGSNGVGAIETSGHSVSIGGHIDAGKGGTWLVDPEDLVVDSTAATTIDNALNAGTDVTLQTTATGTSGTGTVKSGPGDIEVMAPLSWSTSATLTLDAYHSVHFNDLVSITGAGGLDIVTNDGGTGGALRMLGGSVDYGATDNGGTLTINGDSYTLVYTMDDLQNINNDLNGNYALATPQDASGVTNWMPIGGSTFPPLNDLKGFAGNFDGLGNTISNLVLTSSDEFLGLFGYASGTISHLGMIGGSVTGGSHTEAGSIAGFAENIFNSYSSMSVSGGTAGGLAAQATNISNSYATGTVQGISYAGGLAAFLGSPSDGPGSVVSSYATGDVSTDLSAASGPNYVGGLVGHTTSDSVISHVYATGTVTGNGNVTTDAGGLIGYAQGNVDHAYATGDVSATGSINDNTGGLLGYWTNGSSVSHSHATGDVTGLGNAGGLIATANLDLATTISDDRASGKVTIVGLSGGDAGGLIGGVDGSPLIVENSHATGAIIGDENVGGLLGAVGGDFTVTGSYATGNVTGIGSVGGLVGAAQGDHFKGSAIVGSYATGKVTGQKTTEGVGGDGIGGLVGSATKMNIQQSYATGRVTGANDGVGGLIGRGIYVTISESHATGPVSGQDDVGGLLGEGSSWSPAHAKTVSVKDSYATGTVRAQGNAAGGLIGSEMSKSRSQSASIATSYATGRVYGGDDVGGFAGVLGGTTVVNSYATGAVHGDNIIGGFVGLLAGSKEGVSSKISTSYSAGAVFGRGNNDAGFAGEAAKNSISTSYWDTDTSGLKHPGIGNRPNSHDVLGLTTAQFQSGLPAGFDNTVWAQDPSINHGLPYLIALASSY